MCAIVGVNCSNWIVMQGMENVKFITLNWIRNKHVHTRTTKLAVWCLQDVKIQNIADPPHF